MIRFRTLNSKRRHSKKEYLILILTLGSLSVSGPGHVKIREVREKARSIFLDYMTSRDYTDKNVSVNGK